VLLGFVFAVVCWAVWYLSPHTVALLSFDREAIVAGQWWRLWTAHFTHFKFYELILNTAVVALMGLMMGRFVTVRHLLFSLLFVMPLLLSAMMVVMPSLMVYRGASGVAAMMVMLTVCFMIVESKRFSLGYCLGLLLLLLFVAKLAMEGAMLFLHTPWLHLKSSHAGGLNSGWLHANWLIQCFGVLAGLALFNALHQIYATKTAKNEHYRGASVGTVRHPRMKR